MFYLDGCSCLQLPSLPLTSRAVYTVKPEGILQSKTQYGGDLPKTLKRLLKKTWRPCRRKSLPPSSAYTHCSTSPFPIAYSRHTPIYSLTELLSVPLICCFGDSKPSGWDWCLQCSFLLCCFTLVWLTPMPSFCLNLNVISFKKPSFTPAPLKLSPSAVCFFVPPQYFTYYVYLSFLIDSNPHEVVDTWVLFPTIS